MTCPQYLSPSPSTLGGPRLGYLHLTEPCQVLVLYDAAAQPTVDFKTLRQSMAAAVRQALENNGHRGEGLEGWGGC